MGQETEFCLECRSTNTWIPQSKEAIFSNINKLFAGTEWKKLRFEKNNSHYQFLAHTNIEA